MARPARSTVWPAMLNRHANGDRFVAEDSYHSRTSGFFLGQPGAVAYLVVDEEHMERPDFPLIKFVDGWETIVEIESH